MKNVTQIAKMTNKSKTYITSFVSDFVPAEIVQMSKESKLYNEYQVELICEMLKIEYVYLESKINP
jgi:hypothetical protein